VGLRGRWGPRQPADGRKVEALPAARGVMGGIGFARPAKHPYKFLACFSWVETSEDHKVPNAPLGQHQGKCIPKKLKRGFRA
jgi:hypothetical protein